MWMLNRGDNERCFSNSYVKSWYTKCTGFSLAHSLQGEAREDLRRSRTIHAPNRFIHSQIAFYFTSHSFLFAYKHKKLHEKQNSETQVKQLTLMDALSHECRSRSFFNLIPPPHC